ncbi:MAG: hypothetical protein ACTSXO_03760 [Candidatus Heimdallarchaeota archaeon]
MNKIKELASNTGCQNVPVPIIVIVDIGTSIIDHIEHESEAPLEGQTIIIFCKYYSGQLSKHHLIF